MPSYKRLDENGASRFAEEIFAKVKDVVDAIPGGGGGGDASAVSLTMAQYQALSTAEKMNGTIYFVTDADGGGSSATLSSIAVTTLPTTQVYSQDDNFNSSGLIVTATYSDGAKANVTNQCTLSPDNGSRLSTVGVNQINVSYTEGGVTKTTSFNVLVNAAGYVNHIPSMSVTTPPTKTQYALGESLDLTGLVITATLVDGSGNSSAVDVTNQCTFTPAEGTSISYLGDITVNASYSYSEFNETRNLQFTVTGVDDSGVSLVRHDYIQFDGLANHFITTPYSVNADYEVTIVFDAISNRQNQAVIGITGGGYYNRLLQFANEWYGGTGGQQQGIFSKPLTGKHTYVTNRNGKCYFDDEEVLNFTPMSVDSVKMLIGYSYGGTVFDGKVYEYKIKRVSTGETVFHGFPFSIRVDGNAFTTILRDSERNISIKAPDLQAYDDA